MLVQLPKYKAAVVGGVDCLAMYRGGDVIWRGEAVNPWDELYAILNPGALSLEIFWPDYRFWFQDAAGTVPCTAIGQSVMCWKSLSGTMLSQSLIARAPIIATLPNGNLTLSFDAVDDAMSTATTYPFGPASQYSHMLGARIVGDTGSATPMTIAGLNAVTTRFDIVVRSQPATYQVSAYARANAGTQLVSSASINVARRALPSIITQTFNSGALSGNYRDSVASTDTTPASGALAAEISAPYLISAVSFTRDISVIWNRRGPILSAGVMNSARDIVNSHMGAY